jgi:methionine-S-sulfoxide reductase
MNRIVLAGGCFWGVEAYFKLLKGVSNTNVGYVNGNFDNPTYEDLCAHRATHAEAVEIFYDAQLISLVTLLNHMFRFIDPTLKDQQGHDIGHQYRTGVYFKETSDELIVKSFLSSKQKEFKKPLVVEVEKEKGFFLAEKYHQDYLDKNPYGYCHINLNLVRPEEKNK